MYKNGPVLYLGLEQTKHIKSQVHFVRHPFKPILEFVGNCI
jgi:hypothetical protein